MWVGTWLPERLFVFCTTVRLPPQTFFLQEFYSLCTEVSDSITESCFCRCHEKKLLHSYLDQWENWDPKLTIVIDWEIMTKINCCCFSQLWNNSSFEERSTCIKHDYMSIRPFGNMFSEFDWFEMVLCKSIFLMISYSSIEISSSSATSIVLPFEEEKLLSTRSLAN